MKGREVRRLLSLIRRELRAREVHIVDSGAPGRGDGSVIRAALPGGRELEVVLPGGADEGQAQARLSTLVEAFSETWALVTADDLAPRPPPDVELVEVLRELVDEARAVDALVIDADSPMVWATASGEHGEAPGRAVLTVVQDDENGEARGVRLPALSKRAVGAVRALGELPALHRGGHVHHTVRDDDFGLVARSFASIYVLTLVFDAPFDQLAAERAMSRALPAVERLVVALPPPDPTSGAAAGRPRPRRLKPRGLCSTGVCCREGFGILAAMLLAPLRERAGLAALSLFAAASLVAAPASAADPAGAFPWVVGWGGYTMATILGAVGLVVTAALVGRFAPERRRHMRVAVTLYVLYLLALAFGWALGLSGSGPWSAGVLSVATLLFHALLIDLVSVALFFLTLPKAGIDLPDIARDLIVGLAYAVAILALMRRLGVEVSSLLATSAVASVILGVSIGPTLANVFGGVALQVDGSITEGDWVRLPDKIEGRVRQVRWRHTVIETRNHDTLIVPNSQLLQQNILILGRRGGENVPHRMWVYFYVEPQHPPARVVEVVAEMLKMAKIDGVAASPPPSCICLDLGRDPRGAIYYAVRYFLTDLSRDDPVSSEVMVRVFTALSRAGIPLAASTQVVSVQSLGPEARAEAEAREVQRRVALLDKIELFGAMTPDEKHKVAAKLRPAPFTKGEVITRQGAEAHWLYILSSGSADIVVHPEGGTDRVVASVKAPNIVGEMGLLTGAPRLATVIATSVVECLRLDKEDFREVLIARSEVAAELSTVLAQRQAGMTAALQPEADGGKGSVEHAQHRILESVKRFFGLDNDEAPSSSRQT